LGGTDKNDHLAGNVPVKQNIIPNKGVPSTLQFAPYDNTVVAGERTNSVAPFQINAQIPFRNNCSNSIP